jgi:hypothetical protein
VRLELDGKLANMRFDSMKDFADLAWKYEDNSPMSRLPSKEGARDGRGYGYDGDEEFFHAKSREQIKGFMADGWDEHLEEVFAVSEETLKTVASEYDLPSFHSYYDVTGADVDVARYLSGEPECMIAHHMVDTPHAGRVVTITANIAVNAMTETRKMIARGKAVVALVHAIESLGLRTELYVELQVRAFMGGDNGYRMHQITKLKDASDSLDPAMIMWAYAHPAFFRGLGLASMNELPARWKEDLDVYGTSGSYGQASSEWAGTDMYPEGTIMVPTSLDRDNPHDFVVEHLKGLGII